MWPAHRPESFWWFLSVMSLTLVAAKYNVGRGHVTREEHMKKSAADTGNLFCLFCFFDIADYVLFTRSNFELEALKLVKEFLLIQTWETRG